MISVTIIFDIGKTNKKLVVLDQQFNILYQLQTTIEEIFDEDNFPSENLDALTDWMFRSLKSILDSKEFIVEKINFSTYGATLVYLDDKGNVLTPVYNYLKEVPGEIISDFLSQYSSQVAVDTASPILGMLNAGLQLYWVKKTHPALFGQIRFALHLPQYLSYLFTGKFYSDITSIGCHTLIWHFERNDYHDWVYLENINEKLAPIQNSDHTEFVTVFNHRMQVGIGVHDSSAALVPYLRYSKQKFLLLSTGTWCVTLNPFRDDRFSETDMNQGCLNYLRFDRLAVRATSIFLGNEFQLQVKKLSDVYKLPEREILMIEFNQNVYDKWSKDLHRYFCFQFMNDSVDRTENLKTHFYHIADAYHKLIIEMSNAWLEHLLKTVDSGLPELIYIDGGFTQNMVFLKVLKQKIGKTKLMASQFVSGAAIGAAIIIAGTNFDAKALKPIFNFKNIK